MMRKKIPADCASDVHRSLAGSPRRFYSMVDLFAGCGGLSLGFEQAGFTPTFVCEVDKEALATYLRNRRHDLGGVPFADNPNLRCRDAHELQGRRLEQLKSDLENLTEASLTFGPVVAPECGGGSNLDVIAGGPPCQGYSGIGIRRSYAVDRKEIPSNLLYQRMSAIIKDLRPRLFLFENVRGLLNARWERTSGRRIFPDVRKEFEDIPGYVVRHSVVYAKDYGVPQNRPRILLVGARRDIVESSSILDPGADAKDAVKCRFLPPGTPSAFPDLVDLLGDLEDPEVPAVLRSGIFPAGPFATTEYPHEPVTDIQRRMRTPDPSANSPRTELTDQEYSKHRPGIVEKFTHMLQNDGEIPEKYRTKKFAQRVLKARWEGSEPNITATSLPDDYVHYSQPRVLTVREWARLQFFPDWYQFAGKRTTGGIRRAGNPQAGIFDREVPKYTQIGNAVPVGLASCVGKHFIRVLKDALGS